MGPPAADGPLTHWAVEAREPDERDWLAACRAAPHLGYELAYQGLSTLVMGPMTIPHLGIMAPRPCRGVSAPLTPRRVEKERKVPPGELGTNTHISIKLQQWEGPGV